MDKPPKHSVSQVADGNDKEDGEEDDKEERDIRGVCTQLGAPPQVEQRRAMQIEWIGPKWCGKTASCPYYTKKYIKQSMCRGRPLATESEELAAGAVQCAILDTKNPDLGCQDGLMATTKCQFSERENQ